jgi:hypothetical protein
MQATGRGPVRPPIGVALDADFGNRLDAMLAVAMLNGFTAKTEARRISLSVSRPSLTSAKLADVVSGFYRPRPVGGPGGGVGAITEGMIGMPEGSSGSDDPAALGALLTKASADGTPLYSSAIAGLVNTAESGILIRNLLLAQHDGNAAIVLAGPATGLVRILGLYRSGPQITAKCRALVVAAGSFPSGQPETSVKADIAAAKKLFAEWQTPIVGVGAEVGEALPARVSRRIFRGCRRIRSSTRIAPSSRCHTTHRRRRWRRCSTRCIPMRTTSSCPTLARSACWTTGARGSRRRPMAGIGT